VVFAAKKGLIKPLFSQKRLGGSDIVERLEKRLQEKEPGIQVMNRRPLRTAAFF
jgi:hypothetical protein